MNRNQIPLLILASTLLLSACSGIESFMSDDNYSRHDPAVTHPVPRTHLSPENKQSETTQPSTTATVDSTSDNSSQIQPAPQKPVQAAPLPNGVIKQSVVPNVAPSLGE